MVNSVECTSQIKENQYRNTLSVDIFRNVGYLIRVVSVQWHAYNGPIKALGKVPVTTNDN